MKSNFSSILKTQTYTAFKDQLKSFSCTRCELSEGRTQIVVDRGNPKANVVIIGEAPGAEEDKIGKSFVGRSGRLLDTLFKEVGFDTNEESLIMNVAKCRPPENRPPKQNEIEACKDYFNHQLALIKPDFLLLLGATALKHVLPHLKKSSMKEIVGQSLTSENYPNTKIMVVYHPAYILRDPRKRPDMIQLLKKFLKLTKKSR